MAITNSQVKRIMQHLKCSEEEALQIYEDDKKVDRMSMKELKAELGEEVWGVMKEMSKTGTRNMENVKTTRTRKENPTKAGIIAELNQFLTEIGYDSVNITNKERQIAFKVGENDYELTLVQKRKPKN